ncbi:hypothetical protein EUTSA_v100175781mg, partial [Eutrema salsugineum]
MTKYEKVKMGKKAKRNLEQEKNVM